MGNKKYFGPPKLIEEEFKTNLIVPEGYLIFVQSCGDLFAQNIPAAWIKRVFRRIRQFPDTTFLLQTKNPARFFDFDRIPENCILGTTLESNVTVDTKAPSTRERAYTFMILDSIYKVSGGKRYRLMLSLEPIIDFQLDLFVNWIWGCHPEFVSIGANTGKVHLPEPSAEKLKKLIKYLEGFTEVRLKDNLKRILEAKE